MNIPTKNTNYSDRYHKLALLLKDEYSFTERELSTLRDNLNKCRVSKILRERLLKLFGLYNSCVEDPLFTTYFLELKGALTNILQMAHNFNEDKSISIQHITKSISESISAFEEAYYNRLYQKNIKDTNLEYNGGIQQYITSLDWVYKLLLRVVTQKNINANYLDSFVFVSGYESATSARSNLRLDINQLTYPELFVTSVWKEASNFTHPFLYNKGRGGSKSYHYASYLKQYNIWVDFISRERAVKDLKEVLCNAAYFNVFDETCILLTDLLNSKMIDYFYIDLQTYHFGFNRNFELFYHFYWKYFLQLSQNYNRNGHVDRKQFLAFLFRICIVSFADIQEIGVSTDMSAFLKSLKYTPFDPSLSDLWLTCFDKTFECADTVWKELKKFHFEDICTCEIAALEKNANFAFVASNHRLNNVAKVDPAYFLQCCKDYRKDYIKKIQELIQRNRLAIDDGEDEYLHDTNYIICLLSAYLQSIKELDVSVEKSLKCVPRKNEGTLWESTIKDEIRSNLIGISADPMGGMFIGTINVRKRYFSYRCVLFRSLWDYTMKSKIYSDLFKPITRNA